MIGALLPLAIVFALMARSRRVIVLGTATAVASAAAYAVAQAFEGSVCPNAYANDCHALVAVTLLYWVACLGPVAVAAFVMGPLAARSWRAYVALAVAALFGLSIAVAPSVIRDTRIDGDSLFAMVFLPVFLVPLLVAAVIGSLVRGMLADRSRSPDASGNG